MNEKGCNAVIFSVYPQKIGPCVPPLCSGKHKYNVFLFEIQNIHIALHFVDEEIEINALN